jgi:hypothetical protein
VSINAKTASDDRKIKLRIIYYWQSMDVNILYCSYSILFLAGTDLLPTVGILRFPSNIFANEFRFEKKMCEMNSRITIFNRCAIRHDMFTENLFKALSTWQQ